MFSRNLDGQILTIAASGWTWHGKFVLQDYETGSLWWTGLGLDGNDEMICIAGPLQDSRLPRLDAFRGFWRSWRDAHPQTTFMVVRE